MPLNSAGSCSCMTPEEGYPPGGPACGRIQRRVHFHYHAVSNNALLNQLFCFRGGHFGNALPFAVEECRFPGEQIGSAPALPPALSPHGRHWRSSVALRRSRRWTHHRQVTAQPAVLINAANRLRQSNMANSSSAGSPLRCRHRRETNLRTQDGVSSPMPAAFYSRFPPVRRCDVNLISRRHRRPFFFSPAGWALFISSSTTQPPPCTITSGRWCDSR